MFWLAVSSGVGVALARMVLLAGTKLHTVRVQLPALRLLLVIAFMLAFQFGVILWFRSALSGSMRTAVIWGSHVVMLAAVLAAAVNCRVPAMWLVAAGLALNLLVMGANGGLMPTSPETLVRGGQSHMLSRVALGQPKPHSKDVLLLPSETRLELLGDRWVVPVRRGSFSTGDVFMAIGVVLVLATSVTVETVPETEQRTVPRRPLIPVRHFE
jgi:hypothetical protein